MDEETFVCDECGNTFPKRQMKEAFIWQGDERIKRQLCPEDLDKAMNEGTVHGVVGDEKKAAASITPDENPGERKSMK